MHIGVRNRTQEPQVLLYDSRPKEFKPGEIRIIEGVPADFVESRMNVNHPTKPGPDGSVLRSERVVGTRLFEVVSIDDALKAGARPEEDPRVAAIHAEEARKKAERTALISEIKAALVEDGWTPPAPVEQPAKGRGGR